MSRPSLSSLRATEASFGRLALLIGQSFALGLSLALLIVAANALFLPEFGSGALPYAYITVAILGSLLFYGYAELERRWSLPALSIVILVLLTVFYFLSWLILRMTGARWVPFALMVSFSLVIQMGFVILGGQAGRLFDVRQLKALFPRIVLGFAIGFLVGGFLAAPLAGLMNGTENLVLAVVFATLVFLAFLLAVDRRYHAALVQRGTPGRQQPSKSIWQLLTKRFVLFIVLYQMLAIMASQLLDYMVLDQAAARFADSEALTKFFGGFVVGINASDVLFLALFAGLLLSRFGLNFGLMVNPVIDGIILLAEVLVFFLVGRDSGLFFGLNVGARIIDITLTDGARRGAINTAYQALPASQRVTVQTGVEGIAAPVALGLAGIVLLAFNAISGLSIVYVVIVTGLITLLWIGTASGMYRHYAESLRRSLTRRVLDKTELTLDDSTSMAVIERFVQSGDLAEVRLALDALESTEHESLERWLLWLAEQSDASLRSEALERIERLKIIAAGPMVDHLTLEETDPGAKAAAVRAFCALREAEAVDLASAYLSDSEPEVRLGAAVGLLRYGGIAGVLKAGEWLRSLERSTDPDERYLVAEIIGQVEVSNFYQPLLSLLVDPDWQVRCAALTAAECVRHPRLLPLVMGNLPDRRTRSTAAAAIIAYGHQVVPLADQLLTSSTIGDAPQAGRIARICGQIGGQQAETLLLKHIGHQDTEVRYHVLAALRAAGFCADQEAKSAIEAQLRAEIEYGARLFVAAEDLGQEEAVDPLRRALDDDLDRTRQRVFLLLSFLYDARAVIKAGEQLQSAAPSARALALEMLDVTLTSKHKALVLPLVAPDLAPSRRVEALSKLFVLPSMSRDERLNELAQEPLRSGRDSWRQTAVIYAAGRLGLTLCLPVIEKAAKMGDFPLRETAAWSLSALAPERFRDWAASLSPDDDPRLLTFAQAVLS